MLDPRELYELTEEASDDPIVQHRPVMLEAMTGVVDAGNAVGLAGEHLLTALEHRVVATFDIDQLLDYRSRRPAMIFSEDHWESYAEPVLAIYQLRDESDVPFLLLTGPEPDLQWKRFSAAVRGLVAELGVRLSVGINAIPMAVPHTRPASLTAHASRKELIVGHEPWLRRLQVPGSAGHLVEYELGHDGRDAMGFAVHVPHYLSQTTYPAATEALLTSISKATGLMLPLDGLRSAAMAVTDEVNNQIAQGGEAAALVQALEEQYDAYQRGRQNPEAPAAENEEKLPTADELGEALERFLAEQSEPGGPNTLP
ncbi:PAC2 family protein [Frankia sp. AgB32]|uniref:proteasome assembly chaperone family protein n=1 Tax=Frankia sp. AgB32 TaxID=631119 RepID=UPI0020101340|nr:PAC2 family protein [Frankia sp. AgB32]MCK9895588.1 PAC2 family protein [Frankia sp. AgB32]